VNRALWKHGFPKISTCYNKCNTELNIPYLRLQSHLADGLIMETFRNLIDLDFLVSTILAQARTSFTQLMDDKPNSNDKFATVLSDGIATSYFIKKFTDCSSRIYLIITAYAQI
jgi:hypothetical protein